MGELTPWPPSGCTATPVLVDVIGASLGGNAESAKLSCSASTSSGDLLVAQTFILAEGEEPTATGIEWHPIGRLGGEGYTMAWFWGVAETPGAQEQTFAWSGAAQSATLIATVRGQAPEPIGAQAIQHNASGPTCTWGSLEVPRVPALDLLLTAAGGTIQPVPGHVTRLQETAVFLAIGELADPGEEPAVAGARSEEGDSVTCRLAIAGAA